MPLRRVTPVDEKALPGLRLARDKQVTHWLKNPRVDGSIPSLATISKILICNGF
jgi:hypothetical protein